MRLRRANTLVAGIGLLLVLSPIVVNTRAALAAGDDSKRVKIVGGGVELIETALRPEMSQQTEGRDDSA